MPIAGMVATLCDEPELRAYALEALAALPGVTLGPAQRTRKLPLVLESSSLPEQQDRWNEVSRVPGVLWLDLVFESFEDVESVDTEELPSRWRAGAASQEPMAHRSADDGTP